METYLQHSYTSSQSPNVVDFCNYHVYYIMSTQSTLLKTHVFFINSLRATPNYIPLKMKVSDQEKYMNQARLPQWKGGYLMSNLDLYPFRRLWSKSYMSQVRRCVVTLLMWRPMWHMICRYMIRLGDVVGYQKDSTCYDEIEFCAQMYVNTKLLT